MQVQESRPRWGILIGLFSVLGILAALPFLFFRPPQPQTYQIQNFMGKVEVYSKESNAWVTPKRGSTLTADDKIRTGPGGEIDIQVPDQIRLRIKENSELEVRKPPVLERALRYRIHLLKGNILGSTDEKFKGQKLEISTPTLVAAVRGTVFQIEADPQSGESEVCVLRGVVKVRAVKSGKSVVVRDLQRTEVKHGAPPLEPVRVSRLEWDAAKEAYDLLQKSGLLEAGQINLSKEAGTLFQYVFDHGTFYTPKLGFAEREFVKDERSEQTHLEIKYDVFPVGSFVGVYLKTRNMDASKFKGLKFKVRGNPDEGFPESFRIELKGKSGIVTAFHPRNLKKGWQDFQFDFRFRKLTPVEEVTIVFTNDRVGTHKTGLLYLSEIDLIPAD